MSINDRSMSRAGGRVGSLTDGYTIKVSGSGSRIPSTFWDDPTWAFLAVGTEQLQLSCRLASHLSLAKLLSRQVIVAVKLPYSCIREGRLHQLNRRSGCRALHTNVMQ
jgi:hypothetical protein